MRRRAFLWLLAVACLGAACTTLGLEDMTVFEFRSGGANHPSGHGEWRVHLDADGTFRAEHDVAGTVTAYGPYTLAAAENDALWMRIRTGGFEIMVSTERQGIPDEPLYTVTTGGGRRGAHTFTIWRSDSKQYENLTWIIRELAQLIEQYTGQKAVL